MPEIRRWGKEYVDRRNWKEYNESLVRRGEILLDFDVLEEWEEGLKKANDGKRGAMFRYPEAFMRLLAYMHVLFHLPYRQEERFIKSLSKYVDGLRAPDWSTIWERTKALDMKLDGVKTNEPISVAIDSSGIKVSNSGDWIRKKWKAKKGYLKIHFAVDTKTKQIVSMDVTSEKVHDGKRLKRLVKRARERVRVKRVLGDGAYDSRDNFNFLASSGIKPVIRVRSNSVPRSKGCQSRKLAVIEQKRFKPKAWGRIHRFGYRWRVEGAFSSIKRIFGEYASARKFVNMTKEMLLKASIYNGFMAALA